MIILVSGGMVFAILQEVIYVVYNRRAARTHGVNIDKAWRYVL